MKTEEKEEKVVEAEKTSTTPAETEENTSKKAEEKEKTPERKKKLAPKPIGDFFDKNPKLWSALKFAGLLLLAWIVLSWPFSGCERNNDQKRGFGNWNWGLRRDKDRGEENTKTFPLPTTSDTEPPKSISGGEGKSEEVATADCCESDDEKLLRQLEAVLGTLKTKEEILKAFDEIERLRKKLGFVDQNKKSTTINSNVKRFSSGSGTVASTPTVINNYYGYSKVESDKTLELESAVRKSISTENVSTTTNHAPVVVEKKKSPKFPMEILTREGTRLIESQEEYDSWLRNYRKSGGNSVPITEKTENSSGFYKEEPYLGGIRVFRDKGEWENFIGGKETNYVSSTTNDKNFSKTTKGFRKEVPTRDGTKLITSKEEYDVWIQKIQSQW